MNCPDRVIFLYMFLTCTLVGAIFVEWHNKSEALINPSNAVALFYIFSIISGILALVKIFLMIFHHKTGTDTLRKCKQNRLIGFGGIIFFAHLPRVLVYFEGTRDFFISIGTICLIACSLFYLLFASGMESIIRWNESKNKTLYKVLNFLNAAGLIISILGATESSEIGGGRKVIMEIVVCQLVFFALGFFSLKEFCGVVNGSMELKKKDVEVELESVKVVGGDDKDAKDENVKEEENEKSELRLDCNICAIDYDYKTRTPRILSACGHTICESCVKRIMGRKKSIVCPFCQKMTVIFEKSAPQFPKNYETIAVMEWKSNNG